MGKGGQEEEEWHSFVFGVSPNLDVGIAPVPSVGVAASVIVRRTGVRASKVAPARRTKAAHTASHSHSHTRISVMTIIRDLTRENHYCRIGLGELEPSR